MNKTVITYLIFLLTGCAPVSSQISDNAPSANMGRKTPTEVVRMFWAKARNDGDQGLADSTSPAPDSYWKQCDGPTEIANPGGSVSKMDPEDGSEAHLVSPDPLGTGETEADWSRQYLSLAASTARFIKANKVEFGSVETERILGDEALVIVAANNAGKTQHFAFYLTETNESWRIFLIDSDTADDGNIMVFAAPRPACAASK